MNVKIYFFFQLIQIGCSWKESCGVLGGLTGLGEPQLCCVWFGETGLMVDVWAAGGRLEGEQINPG